MADIVPSFSEAPQRFLLRQAVEDALDRVSRYTAEKKLELIGSIPENAAPYLLGDEERLNQVLVRMLNDIIVLLHDGGEILLEVESRIEDDGVVTHFVARGTGVRIPEELDLAEGTGNPEDTDFNIPTSFLLADRLGADLRMDRLDSDTVISRLTLKTEPTPGRRAPTEPVHLGQSVLLVDDNAHVRRVLSHHLSAWGLEVQSASSAGEALNWLPFHNYSVAVIDVDMPVMSGYDLVAAVDKKIGVKKLPVVLLVAPGQDEVAEAKSPAEPVAVLTKPVKVGDLRVAIQVAIDQVTGNLPQPSGVIERPVFLNKELQRSLSQGESSPEPKSARPSGKLRRPESAQPSGKVRRPEPAQPSGKVRRPELSGKTRRPELGRRSAAKKDLNSIRRSTATSTGLRILLAEDNMVNQRVVMKMLNQLGHNADAVNNGQEAVDALLKTSYDVVFMDVLMPKMDGLEATRKIRRRVPTDRQPRIVAMTAYGVPGDRERCLAAGMETYLAKPIRIEDLTAVLSDIRKKALG